MHTMHTACIPYIVKHAYYVLGMHNVYSPCMHTYIVFSMHIVYRAKRAYSRESMHIVGLTVCI